MLMKKITSFLIGLFIMTGLTAVQAQSQLVGTYDGGLSLSHVTGGNSSESDLQLTISEGENGTLNVTFPSISVMGRFDSGAILIEDVTATPQGDGSYTLSKETFNLSFTTSTNMTMQYPNSTLSGVITPEGEADITVQVIQNPTVGALTTAEFLGNIPDLAGVIAAAYGGSLQQLHKTGTSSTADEQIVIITKENASTATVSFPAISVLGNFATGKITVEGVSVTADAEGSFTLSKDVFTISATLPNGMTISYPYSTLSGKVTADGNAEITVEAIQNPAVGALTTATFNGTPLDASTFIWGTATWNIEPGNTYANIEEFQEAGLALTYPNPTGYNLTFLNIIAANCEIYIDDSTEPISYSASAQASTVCLIKYDFAEGHDYRIEVTGARLVQANLATRVTDTLSLDDSHYTFSFRINGPELQRTIHVDGYMSLAITDQNATPTLSLVDVSEITAALGIDDISEAAIHPLNVNGSYNDRMDYFDYWRDADGEFTLYNGGYNQVAGHNAYPAVYCIKLNATADTVSYYFYDYWKEYTPDESESIPGIGTETNQAPLRAPQTSYNSIIWDWDNGDGTTTQYKRNYRVDEGKDYEANTLFVANGKSVLLNATLHFVSQEEYATLVGIREIPAADALQGAGNSTETIYSISGIHRATLQKGLNIVRKADGKAYKVLIR